MSQTVYTLLAEAAGRASNAPALTFLPRVGAEPVRLDHRAFFSRVKRTARFFRALGIGRHDVVTILSPPIPDMIVALWAAEAVAIANPINIFLRSEDLAASMRAAGSRLLVALGPDPEFEIWDRAVAAARQVPTLISLVSIGDSSGDAAGGSLAERLPDDDSELDDLPSSADIAAIFSTGGTSAKPKLAPQTHANQVAAVTSLNERLGFDQSTRALNGLPFFHVAGALAFGLGPLAAGGELILPTAAGLRNPDVMSNYWKIVEQLRPTSIGGVPTSIGAFLEVPVAGADISSVRDCVTGGALLMPGVVTRFAEQFGLPVHNIWGMTECSSALAATDPKRPSAPGTVGYALRGMAIEARSLLSDGSVGEVVAPSKPGVLVARGPNVFPGYLGDTPSPFTKDGWLITGDMGSIDGDGVISVTGRAKDVIIRGGHNIDPLVIEEAAQQHTMVVTSAAVGLPDRYAGEVPILYAVLRSDGAAVVADLTDHLRRTVPEPPARPRTIVPIAALPLTAAGKIDKAALRRDAAIRVAREALQAEPGLAGPLAKLSAEQGPSGQIILTASIDAGSATMPIRHLAQTAERLLSGFSFAPHVVVGSSQA